MKTHRSFAIIAALVAGASLSSCYVPPGGSVTVESAYRPGYSITALPPGYRTEVISGTRYYHHNNVYYRPHGHGYVVVESPRHSGPPHRDWDRDGRPNWSDPNPHYENRGTTVIRRLPNGYRVVNHRGHRYYRAGDVYYQAHGDGYVIVRSPF